MNTSPTVGMDKEYKAKQEALKKRLVGLGSSNPVVKQAIQNNTPKPERDYKEWKVVEELYYAAERKFREGDSLKTCVNNLIAALQKVC